MISEETNIEKIKKLGNILVRARNDDFNRKLLEQTKIQGIVSIELNENNNTIRTINSGFNHVLAKLAKKNNIKLVFDLEKIRNSKSISKTLTKMKEIIMHARKNQIVLGIINYKDKKNALSLLQVLGASSQQVAQAVAF